MTLRRGRRRHRRLARSPVAHLLRSVRKSSLVSEQIKFSELVVVELKPRADHIPNNSTNHFISFLSQPSITIVPGGRIIGLGAAFVVAMSFWQLPKESMYIFIMVIFLASFVYRLKAQKKLEPVIEEESIV